VQSTASNPGIDALAVTATAEYNRREPVADPELWERATEAWEKASQPYEVAYCCYRWAEAELDVRKSPRAASVPLRKSHEIASSLGAATLQQLVEDLARRSRITLTPNTSEKQTAPASGAARLGLTPREQDVLRALMLGLSNREIAKRLYLSPRTVEVHVSNLLGKLGASNRGQAQRAAAHLGMLPEA
jgi:DNA-binding CsgD family transcriptional regulator